MKTWKQITTELNEAKFKLFRGQEELKRSKEKDGREQIEIIYAQDKRGKHMFVCRWCIYRHPYRNLKDEKEMKDIKKVMMQMREDNIYEGNFRSNK